MHYFPIDVAFIYYSILYEISYAHWYSGSFLRARMQLGATIFELKIV